MSEPCACHGGGDCGCCAGTEPLTPQVVANRPSLDALAYRVGTHSSFLETMKAALSSNQAPSDPAQRQPGDPDPALNRLTTRAASDPAIALLDAWAVVADVLTFYQERIANEGYLRTATERRSVLELARLVGYGLRPGVAASVHLAYDLEEKRKPAAAPGSPIVPVSTSVEEPETVIPAGARAQSAPGPGELPQPFETSRDLTARAAWNRLAVRLNRPQQPKQLILVREKPVAVSVTVGLLTTQEPRAHYLLTQVFLDDASNSTKVDRRQLMNGPFELKLPVREETVAVEVSGAPAAAAIPVHLRLNFPARRWVIEIDLDAQRRLAVAISGLDSASLITGVRTLQDDLGMCQLVTVESPRRTPVYLQGIATQLKPNDPLLVDTGASGKPDLYRVVAVAPDAPQDRTRAEVELWWRPRAPVSGIVRELEAMQAADSPPAPAAVHARAVGQTPAAGQARTAGQAPAALRDTTQLSAVLPALGKRPPPQPRNDLRLQRDVRTLFSPGSDLAARLLTVVRPELGNVLYSAWANVPVTPAPELQVAALRTKASPFGSNAPLDLVRGDNGAITNTKEWELILTGKKATEETNVLWLDAAYPQILPGSWIVLERPRCLPALDPSPLVIARVAAVSQRARAEYGLSAKSTRIELDRDWLAERDTFRNTFRDTFEVIRGTAVYAESVPLALAEEPIDPVAEPVCGQNIELAGLYDGLDPGRWLIVSGERTDVGELDPQGRAAVAVAGIPAAELAMLAGVSQGVAPPRVAQPGANGEAADLPGERTHTTLALATPLAYCYKRDTVSVYGNVADATHGETKLELLGSGDGSRTLQQFTLRQPPLTYVSAPTPSGIASTLSVRVNDLLWHQAEGLATLGPTDRSYLLSTGDSGATTVIFGNGERGARLPTGSANVRAAYRSRIGKEGNVKAGQISQLATRPLGVKGVINPLPASGGADPESRDQARRNAPLAVMALERLVSVQDYADFARTFAGIGKASSARLAQGRVRLVHVTISGADDIPILESSDLFRNLAAALRRFGDPRQPVQLQPRDRRLLVVSAEVEVLPDYAFETVAPRVRAAMLDAFGYARRELGEDAVLSQAYRIIQGVRGVALADLRVFDVATGSIVPEDLKKQLAELTTGKPKPRVPAYPERVGRDGVIQPAQLVYLSPEVPDTLILKERKP
ncbi:MAG TPA: putative baseplate assembly protein [Thermoanaerobaculia bacterium]|nr:putative baseplate assembly protein [Thermoanaerobaculia bacterium]